MVTEIETATAICGRCLATVRLADAEYREVLAPTRAEPERVLTERLHPACAALSDRAVELGRRLAPAGDVATQAGL